jgi:hypothetical protein
MFKFCDVVAVVDGQPLTDQIFAGIDPTVNARHEPGEILHNRYRRNPWTSKTPLWFSSPYDE